VSPSRQRAPDCYRCDPEPDFSDGGPAVRDFRSRHAAPSLVVMGTDAGRRR
jgi:hypothetical protein